VPEFVATAEGSISDLFDFIYPVEAACVARAVGRRRSEFATGRILARRAIRDLLGFSQPLPMNADRTPAWPEGVTGSITHSQSHCAAAVALTSKMAALGIDVEDIPRFGLSDVRSFMSNDEIETTLRSLSTSEQQTAMATFFSAKEAFFKCQYTVTRSWLDFHDVIGRLCPETQSFCITLLREVGKLSRGSSYTGRYSIRKQMVYTAVMISPIELISSQTT
jgi:4'-phosphopantetheinyl transferase EntD